MLPGRSEEEARGRVSVVMAGHAFALIRGIPGVPTRVDPLFHEAADKYQRRKRLADDRFADAAFLLLDQALLVEGSPVKDPAEFVKRLNRVMEGAL